MDEELDCVVVGGGAAGLSAALVLGRARAKVAVVDAGRQSNLPAHGVGGLLGHDGRPPSELYDLGRGELARYGVDVIEGEVADGVAEGGRFALGLGDGRELASRRVLLAMGMRYRLPDVPGLEELWGRSAFHCPFCHGWEVRGSRLGVLGSDGGPAHAALMLRGWSEDVTLFAGGRPDPEDAERLERAGVRVDERRVAAARSADGTLAEVELDDGATAELDALMVPPSLEQRSDLPWRLGAERGPATPIAAEPVKVDAMQQTTVPGLFAAGDMTGQNPQVAAAISSGSMAAAAVVRSLLIEDVGLPG